MKILRGKYLLPMDQPPVEDGAVAVEGDRIVAAGPAAEIRAAHAGDWRDLGEVVLTPGLIDAHCHLDYAGMKDRLSWNGSFIQWILQLVELKKTQSETDYLASVSAGLAQLARSGTTTVVNFEAFPKLIERLADPFLRVWWCLELIDLNREQLTGEMMQEALDFVAAHPVSPGGYGLAPHAPYSASGDLFRLAAARARQQGLVLTTHIAESQEEDDMFRRGAGSMYDYFRRAGRPMSDCRQGSAVQQLEKLAVWGRSCLAVHANCLTSADLQMLARAGTSVVHCPRSHRFFQRAPVSLDAYAKQGVNVCLGTDSLASNDVLDMFAEMQELARTFPRVAPQTILEMATVNAAKALNQTGKLGRIAAGASADLIAVPLGVGVVEPYEAVVYADQPVVLTMVAGKELTV